MHSTLTSGLLDGDFSRWVRFRYAIVFQLMGSPSPLLNNHTRLLFMRTLDMRCNAVHLMLDAWSCALGHQDLYSTTPHRTVLTPVSEQ
jgi:hypothetical protein